MPAIIFKIDTLAISNQVVKLATMRKFDLPVAVQQTLTTAAFRVKKETMPDEAKVFTQRKRTFFMANSRAEKAMGLDIDNMKATVGFIPKAGDKSHSVEDLEAQENGGDIKNRSFIALSSARTGAVWQGLIQMKNRMALIRNNTFDANNTNLHGAKNKKEAFILSAIYANKGGKGGFVIGTETNGKGNRFLMRINSAKKLDASTTTKDGKLYKKGNTVVNSTDVMVVKKNRHIRPRPTHFMEKASMTAQGMMEQDFVRIASARIFKYNNTP